MKGVPAEGGVRRRLPPGSRGWQPLVRLALTGWALAAIATGQAALGWAAEPAADGSSTPRVRVGVGGVQRAGFWTPVVVADSATNGRVWVEDADGQPVGSPPLGPAGNAAGGRVRPGRPAAPLVVGPDPATGEPGRGAAVPSRSIRAEAADTASSTTPLLLVDGRFPAAAAAARLAAGDRTPARPVPLVAERGVAPRLPLDLDAFDSALLSGTAAADLPAETLRAIDGWIRCGGSLVFAAGRSAVALAASRSPAAEWLPGSDPRLVPLRQFGAVEAFAGAGGLTKRGPAGGIEVPRFEGPGGVTGMIEVFEGSRPEDLPLVVRRAHGLGVIAWIGIDIDEPWCGSWPACDRLLAALLRGRTASEGSLVVTPPGLRDAPDLTGQLRVALETMPADGGRSAGAVPFEVIIGLGLLYVLALYPLDWWLVSRSGRPWLSWLTLPLLAGGFIAAAWGLGLAWGLETPARLRVAELVDIDAADGLVRGSSWAVVRSPVNGRIDVGIRPAEPLSAGAPLEAAVSWFADSGRGFGGVDAAVSHPSLAATGYGYGPTLAGLREVPVAAASNRLFEAFWLARLPHQAVTSSLFRDPRGLVHGTLAHHLPMPLADCRLLHGGWLYDVGDLEPGEAFDVDAGRGPRSLAAAVTRRTATGDRDRAEPWETSGTDIDRILEVAGLYRAVGGFAFTTLEPGRLGRLDLSGLLAVDRAVLVGFAPAGFEGSAWQVRSTGGTGPASELPRMASDRGPPIRIAIPLPAASADPQPGATP